MPIPYRMDCADIGVINAHAEDKPNGWFRRFEENMGKKWQHQRTCNCDDLASC
jgi:hypothetical protein